MEDPILRKAKLHLDALEQEAEEIRAFIAVYHRLAAPSSELPRSQGSEKTLAQATRVMGSYTGEIEYSSSDEIVYIAREVLKEASPLPLTISELFQTMTELGIKISGKNPKGNLSAKLALPKDIVYVKDEGWYYRPQGEEAPDVTPAKEQSEASRFPEPAKGREAVPGGGP